MIAVAAMAGAGAGFVVLASRPDDSRGEVTVAATTPAVDLTAAPGQAPTTSLTVQPTQTVTHSAYDLAKSDAASVAVPLGSVVTLHDDKAGEQVEISIVTVTDPFDYPDWPAYTGNKW